LQNGSIGELVAVEDKPRDAHECDVGFTVGPVIAWIEWDDGQKRPVDEALLEALDLAYAITVHKAQGSQWPRVVIPIADIGAMDRTMIYTAMTRAQRKVVFVGDESAAKLAVERTPRVELRDVALDLILADELSGAQH
jgi:exodeoxyribonuclease V alpha subunit